MKPQNHTKGAVGAPSSLAPLPRGYPSGGEVGVTWSLSTYQDRAS